MIYRIQEDVYGDERHPWRFEGQGPNGYMTLEKAVAAWAGIDPWIRSAHPHAYISGPEGGYYEPDGGRPIPKHKRRSSCMSRAVLAQCDVNESEARALIRILVEKFPGLGFWIEE